jgi:hypothetical protein
MYVTYDILQCPVCGEWGVDHYNSSSGADCFSCPACGEFSDHLCAAPPENLSEEQNRELDIMAEVLERKAQMAKERFEKQQSLQPGLDPDCNYECEMVCPLCHEMGLFTVSRGPDLCNFFECPLCGQFSDKHLEVPEDALSEKGKRSQAVMGQVLEAARTATLQPRSRYESGDKASGDKVTKLAGEVSSRNPGCGISELVAMVWGQIKDDPELRKGAIECGGLMLLLGSKELLQYRLDAIALREAPRPRFADGQMNDEPLDEVAFLKEMDEIRRLAQGGSTDAGGS